MASHGSSFSSLRTYLQAVAHTPSRFARRGFSVSTSYEEMSRVRARSGTSMRKTLRWFDLVGFGIGGMVGAGVFVTTGHASRVFAGPAVVLSYAIAGFCALLSAFCYTEFAVDMPVAGGAFSYLRVTFGEFAAFITGANLIMDYVMSNAAVARGFTAYFGTTIGISSDKWRITVPSFPKGFNQIDMVAVVVVLLITIVICYSWKNFTNSSNSENPSGFFPFGAAGVFNGAAAVYLSYIGYDAVSTMAEEVKEPVKDIPIGVSGSVIIVTILYCLMAASMCMLLPYDMIDPEAPFSAAFKSDGWGWASRVIGVGASFGILTSLIVAMLGQARYMCVIGRSNVVPAWFAKVHPKTSTPVNASAFLGIKERDPLQQYSLWLRCDQGICVVILLDCDKIQCFLNVNGWIFTAAIALFTDLDVLLNLVSIGTLFVFYMVANAVVYRRYVAAGTTNPWPTVSFLVSFSFTSIMFTLIWKCVPSGVAKAVMLSACGVVAVAILQLFHFTVPQARKPEFWGVPLMPWIPATSIFLNLFLLGSLDGPSYVRFGVFSAVAVLFYVLYSVHASFDAEGDGSLSQKNVEVHMESKEESVDQSFKV
ncbi:cationic amino acid transporter chloroplastic-like [Trifolium pratense]|uniref:Cationic amino acid transporter chloroplastic-like n=1 Tax=Trifolium pratense TaxID=57577 RepID=A0A2K3NYP7_TRIPR|nr:cationic amino acid transporter chloroplastic-like [Trifolium pratense]